MGRIQQVTKPTDWQSILGYWSKLLQLADPDSVCLEVGFSVAWLRWINVSRRCNGSRSRCCYKRQVRRLSNIRS